MPYDSFDDNKQQRKAPDAVDGKRTEVVERIETYRCPGCPDKGEIVIKTFVPPACGWADGSEEDRSKGRKEYSCSLGRTCCKWFASYTDLQKRR